MNPFLLYIGRSSLYLAIFYAFFLLVMRRTSLFRFNRIVLLVGSAVCFVLPLLRLRTAATGAAAAAAAGPLTAVAAAAEPQATALASASAHGSLLLLLYVAGAAAVLSFTTVAAIRMLRTIRSGQRITKDRYKLTILDREVPSFSWGRHIVMGLRDYVNNQSILTHEMMHADRHHSLDIILFTVVTVLHWFNPLAWITLSELKLLHEYEADEAVINKGIDATQYQLLLVKKAVGEHRFSLANGFQHSKLKNRINMMLKKQTPGWMRFAYLLLLPVLAGAMFACNPAREQEQELVPESEQLETKAVEDALRAEYKEDIMALIERGEAVPFQVVEEKPSFHRGDANTFANWIGDHLKYPESAKKAGVQGRVLLEFTIGKDGKVGDVKVLRGVSEDVDAEAVRVVESSPKWKPGRIDGKPVAVAFNLPITFKLDNGTIQEIDEADAAKEKEELKAAVERGESIPFSLLEDKPTFDGGDANKFSEWVNSQLIYPEASKTAGEQGRVTLQFTVDPEGNVVNAKVLRGVSEELDAEALRVISNSPKWEPGRIDGKPVPVTYTFPIVFKLK
jgi:TonB family protein